MDQPQEESGKMFVGGLSWESTQDDLCKYFSRFGEVIDCVVMKNGETGRSRGFGFVTFKDPACVEIVLAGGPHILDGRTIDPKACNPRSMQRSRKGDHPKIFLGGLPSNVTETDLRNCFSKYGKVVEVVIMFDQEKKRSRGFGFLSFEMEDSVNQVCAVQYIDINGKQVECKKAQPRDGKSAFGGMRSNNQWNGNEMGSGGQPPPSMGGPGMGPPSGPPMPNGMPGSMGGYPPPPGWGPPPAAQGCYPSHGMYGPHPGSPGYHGWGPHPGPFCPYPPPGPQYGPPSPAYGVYGYGYSWPNAQGPNPAPAPVPPPPNGGGGGGTTASNVQANTNGSHYSSQQPQMNSSVESPVIGQNAQGQKGSSSPNQISQQPSKQDYHSYNTSNSYAGSAGTYQQGPSSYGPSRTYETSEEFSNSGSAGFGPQGDGIQSKGYNSGSQSGGSGGRMGGGHSQSYHPYRRQ